MFKVSNKDTIVNFEHVIAGWAYQWICQQVSHNQVFLDEVITKTLFLNSY